MKYKIVADSSANLFTLDAVSYASVPLKICTQTKEYVDTPDLSVKDMVEEIRSQGGKSGSSCPNSHEWFTAFGDADCVFAVAITSNLSGSCSAAIQAQDEYMQAYPGRKVCVLDSLSTGPEMLLIIEKLREMILLGLDFEQIEAEIRAYMKHTHLFFCLKSLTNLARNGRVNPAVAAIAGVLGICVVGKASDEGTLEQLHKCRGEKKALKTIVDDMKALGFMGGKVRIDHCLNPEITRELKAALQQEYPQCDVRIGTCGALCSFYAEKGGFLIGFEDGL